MRLRIGLAGAALTLAPFSAAVGQSAPSAEELLRRLEEAEQKIRILERKLENQAEAQTAATAAAPQVRATPTRFSIGTPDGSSFVPLRGVLHVDGRHFEGDGTPATSNAWLLRRVRPVFEGTAAPWRATVRMRRPTSRVSPCPTEFTTYRREPKPCCAEIGSQGCSRPSS